MRRDGLMFKLFPFGFHKHIAHTFHGQPESWSNWEEVVWPFVVSPGHSFAAAVHMQLNKRVIAIVILYDSAFCIWNFMVRMYWQREFRAGGDRFVDDGMKRTEKSWQISLRKLKIILLRFDHGFEAIWMILSNLSKFVSINSLVARCSTLSYGSVANMHGVAGTQSNSNSK